ncbi:restriction endonuclease subunit S [uncultured Erythrobacter sp.]|uniref:restriction endonuclease subunit S n=1 Tax=uncultured Erythrobacter sp. TaxID=263913 RepID=UPI002609277A|nr:restriction endonuclease subunit S [uncultured Erythrobacter sp.]
MRGGIFGNVKLGQVASVNYGYTESASSEAIGPKFLRITDIQDGNVDWTAVPYCEIDQRDFDKHKLEAGDIVFARTGATTGKSFLIQEPPASVPASYLIRLRITDNELSPDYLALFFQTSAYWEAIKQGSSGSAQGGFNASKLKELEVPLPPLEEQKRIVAVLDQAFAALDRARANAEANLADAEELFERELSASFAKASSSSKFLPFSKLCKPLTPKTKIKRKDYLAEGNHPIVSQEADLISGYWNDGKALMRLNEPVVVFGDHTRCLKYVDFDFVVGADGTKVLKPGEGVDASYLYYGLRSIPIAEKGYARHFRFLKEGTLPDLEEDQQRELANHLRDIESQALQLADHYEAKVQDLDDLRQSILQKAFAGELT